MTRYIDKNLLEHAMWKPADALPTTKKEPAPPPQPQPIVALEGDYILMDLVDTYAKGVHNLQKACQKRTASPHPTYTKPDGSLIYRPLTFKENLEARVTDYENNKDTEERKRLFKRWNDSCTGLAYKKGATKFKLIHLSPELITIPEDFKQGYIKVDYDAISGVELDKKDATYNTLLSPSQIEVHPAWLAALEDDAHLLKTYRDIVFAERKTDTAMGFWLRNEIVEDQLRALFVYNLYNYSIADGNNNLSNYGSFLHVAPSGSAAGASRKK